MSIRSFRARWLALPTLLVLSLVALVAMDRWAPGGRGIVKIQGIDPTCYFGTAHSVLFDRDWNLTNELQKFPPSDETWTKSQPASGLPGSPFAVGYSLLAIPFLAAGTALDAMAGNPPDGYSRFALLFYFFANVVFSITGLFLLAELLFEIFGNCPWAIYSTVTAVFLGTSLLVYSFSPMSHALTFLCVSAFLLIWYGIRDSNRFLPWAWLGFIGGVLGITRWQDSLFLAGPILYDAIHWRDRSRNLPSYAMSRGGYAALFAVCWIPQMLQWKTIYGKYLTIPQGNGFLQWPPVHFFGVLFSTSHGWFIWTPLVLLGLLGSFCEAFRSWDRVLPWLAVMLAEVAVLGANTTNWDGSDSFSIRSLTSCLPLVAVGLCGLLAYPRLAVRRTALAAVVACVIFTVAFAAQFRLDMIPRKGRLTAGELLRDKLFFRQAFARRSAHRRALELLDGGHASEAATVANVAIARNREDRFLLADLEQSSRQAGDFTEAAQAHVRLQQLLSRCMF